MPSSPPPRFLLPALFLVSGLAITYQIVLMRLLSIAQWHHFAYMVISVAMLGFGAGGTVMTLLRERIRGHEGGIFFMVLLLFAVSMPLCYVLVQQIPFETFHLVTQGDQWGWLLLLYGVLAIPFLLASACTTLVFFMRPQRVGQVYFVDLLGSGIGAAVAIGALFLFSPAVLPYVLALPVLVVAGCMAWFAGARWRYAWGAVALLAMIWMVAVGMTPVRMSEYKALSYALQFPDAEILTTRHSPLSKIHVVESSMIRETPGQLGNYPFSEAGPLPRQIGLFFDGGAISAVNQYDGDMDRFRFLRYVPPAVAFSVLQEPRTLVIGAGGGMDVWMALKHGAPHVTAVEVDPRVFPLMNDVLGEFSGHLFERPDVRTVLADGRGFLQGEGGEFDLIQIALLDAFNAAASGVYALSESYLYTREAMQLYFRHLSPQGVLAVTRWLKTPPRDAIKMFATLAEALEAEGIENPGDHLAMLRTWNAATLLMSRSPWTDEQIAAIRTFTQTRGFDMDWLPGLQPEEVNQFTVMAEPVYHEAALAILGPERDAFYRNYLFYIRPATDDRPHFFQFFKLDTLPALVREMGTDWVPFVEWGYIALWATLLQGGVASVILILLPLWVLCRRSETGGGRRWVVLYFTALGLAFMFLEIAFIQKFMLFLAYPMYAVAVVLAAFLVFSGLGSLTVDRWRKQCPQFAGWLVVTMAVIGIVVLTAIYAVSLPHVFVAWSAWGDGARIAVSVVLIAPLAFCMGMPLPVGLQYVSDRFAAMVPWAWAINGVASVMGAALATLTAIHLGFRVLVWLAAAIYVLAVPVFGGLVRAGRQSV